MCKCGTIYDIDRRVCQKKGGIGGMPCSRFATLRDEIISKRNRLCSTLSNLTGNSVFYFPINLLPTVKVGHSHAYIFIACKYIYAHIKQMCFFFL